MSERSNRWTERLANTARAALVLGLCWMGVDMAGAQTIERSVVPAGRLRQSLTAS